MIGWDSNLIHRQLDETDGPRMERAMTTYITAEDYMRLGYLYRGRVRLHSYM